MKIKKRSTSSEQNLNTDLRGKNTDQKEHFLIRVFVPCNPCYLFSPGGVPTGFPSASYTSTFPYFARTSRAFDASPTATTCKWLMSRYFCAAFCTSAAVI